MKKIVDLIRKKLENELLKEIKDKDIAKYLDMSASKLALLKTRDSIPYLDIIKLCKDRKWDLNEIFLDDAAYSNCADTYKIKLLDSSDDKKYIKIDKTIIDSLSSLDGIANIEAIKSICDSMEPTVSDRATVLIDCDVKEIERSGIFVIRTVNGILIRRLMKNHQGSIDLISDNAIYPIEKLKLEDMTIVGKVIGIIDLR